MRANIKVSNILEFIIFADDTNIFCIGENAVDVINSINAELAKLIEWFKMNKLSLKVQSPIIWFSVKVFVTCQVLN